MHAADFPLFASFFVIENPRAAGIGQPNGALALFDDEVPAALEFSGAW